MRLRLLLMLVAVLLAGCSRQKSPAIKSADELERFGALSGAKSSHSAELRDELARIESEGATAAQLTRRPTVPTALGTVSAAGSPATGRLGEVFAADLQETLFKQLDTLYPVGPFKFSRSTLQTAIQLKDRYEAQRKQIHKIVAAAGSFDIQLTQGLAADTSCADVVTIGNRLDAIVAAELLYREDLSGAIATVREMTTAIETLAHEKHAVPRITAVHLRGEALRVLEAIATHPQAGRATLRRLADLIDDQLASWPPDGAAWMGDRAVGLHTYELVRDGYLYSILDDVEQSRLRREVGSERLENHVEEKLDQDEMFYLRAMRRTITACRRPYYERLREFREINAELEALRSSLNYPLVADLVLWPGVQEGHRWQALDRARCEAWSIALAASLGEPRPPYQINPLTGSRYVVELRATEVIVDGIDPEQAATPLVIPLRREPAGP